MKRREFLGRLGAAPASLIGAQVASALPAQGGGLLGTADLAQTARPVWEAWKAAYLRNDGRVVDGLQGDASHSEGQAYGALLATEFSDPFTLEKIVAWSEANLAVRGDGLMAWRYMPDADNPVEDFNNASDGDLFMAWALVRAAKQFNHAPYLTKATKIAEALAARCIVANPANPAETLFLPGAQGFVQKDRVVFNPSYIMPRAMQEVAEETGVTELARAAQDAEFIMLGLAESGPIPDWVQADSTGLSPATGFSVNVGYEAMRIPLYFIWSGLGHHPAVTQMERVYSRTVKPRMPVPTIIEASSGVVLEASNDPGYRALSSLVTCARSDRVGADIPAFDPSQPYYPATLQMLTMVAANQVVPECVPI